MIGRLYVIGVGPGDPELLTLKGFRILREVSCICVPKGREDGSSLALSIVQKVMNLDNKEIIEAYFPMRKTKQPQVAKADPSIVTSEFQASELDMRWQETIETICTRLNKGIDIAFITIGDPTIYSTFFYLYDKLLEINPELRIEIIPGVSSINASAAKADISLGLADEKIAILPATYTDNIKDVLDRFDTIVLMKVHRVFDKVLNILDEMNLTDNAVYVLRAGMDGEKIFKNIRDVKESDLDYFSLVIIKK
ncbi:precorrin-2 C(20)-methyltransferase [hot springs metagenome]|uniref:Precorrin-2 C(20)-methyltransferase n=1 Tax=hot springs metagenome TaxID=433727 RepID=A0A5J4L3T8_9ZZZZ